MIKKEIDKDYFQYDFENGEIVRIDVSENVWEYSDTKAMHADNGGSFVYDEINGVAYIMCASKKIVSAVIHAMRDLFGACEWVEPKLKSKR